MRIQVLSAYICSDVLNAVKLHCCHVYHLYVSQPTLSPSALPRVPSRKPHLRLHLGNDQEDPADPSILATVRPLPSPAMTPQSTVSGISGTRLMVVRPWIGRAVTLVHVWHIFASNCRRIQRQQSWIEC